jgi:hypothetical protein
MKQQAGTRPLRLLQAACSARVPGMPHRKKSIMPLRYEEGRFLLEGCKAIPISRGRRRRDRVMIKSISTPKFAYQYARMIKNF